MATHEAAPSELHERQPAATARYIHVQVVDHMKEGRPAVRIKVPLRVATWGLKMAQTVSPDMKNAVDWNSISAMIQEGARGELVHVEDDAEHKTIDVWVE